MKTNTNPQLHAIVLQWFGSGKNQALAHDATSIAFRLVNTNSVRVNAEFRKVAGHVLADMAAGGVLVKATDGWYSRPQPDAT